MEKAELEEGQECRKCNTAVIRVIPKISLKAGQKYRYKSYLKRPDCKTMYMLESEKVYLK